ncbi:MAG: MBL fold metallo-hydrolase [Chloroflexi bacterium]|nr:MBL fold metallo-hydrolase [Chloroflexota bacterium]MBM4449833.1 MBL fold metallo-hydrolase [Chloroflexota bacterium]MBM4454043.1 MBL fold metallo-hydrolase [Chloroflexota bacterium]
MDINWLGHSCFRIKGKEAVLVTDPCHPSIGYALGKLQADIVTVSHFHPGHSYTEAISNDFKVVNSPGEYELKGIFITGMTTFHDSEKGCKLGKNTVYLIECDSMTLCHLGDLGHLPDSDLMEALGEIDVLFLPVGGVTTIGGATAAEIVRGLSPKVVIPMHYRTSVLVGELEPADKFLKELGLKEIVSQPKLSVNRANLPPTTQVVVLDYPHK